MRHKNMKAWYSHSWFLAKNNLYFHLKKTLKQISPPRGYFTIRVFDSELYIDIVHVVIRKKGILDLIVDVCG